MNIAVMLCCSMTNVNYVRSMEKKTFLQIQCVSLLFVELVKSGVIDPEPQPWCLCVFACMHVCVRVFMCVCVCVKVCDNFKILQNNVDP